MKVEAYYVALNTMRIDPDYSVSRYYFTSLSWSL